MTWRRKLDVIYRGQRDYIQGSLVISQAAALFKADFDEGNAARLIQAGFTRLLNGHYEVSDEDPGDRSEGKIIVAAQDGSRTALFIRPDPERPGPPAREADRPSHLTGFSRPDGRRGEAAFAHGGGLDDFLAALIEANKRWHVETHAGVRDVWFLSLYEAALPLADDFYRPAGRFVIENRTVQTVRGRKMTINRIRLKQDGGEEAGLSLVFSFMEAET